MAAVAAAAAVFAGASADVASAAEPATLSDKLVPSRGVLFGIRAKPRAGRTEEEEIQYLQRLIDRPFALERMYARWDQPIPSSRVGLAISKGRQVALSWTATRKDGTAVPWRSIANGDHDAWIASRADALKAFGKPLIFIFHHEPEDDLAKNGSAADYVAAWRHVVSVFRARGVTNVAWGWTMMAANFGGTTPRAAAFYPGDDVIDWISADGYNWFGSPFITGQPWRSFYEVFRNFYNWSAPHGKPIFIAEYGVMDDTITPDPLRKAQWFADMREQVKRWPLLKALTYYNAWEWPFDSSAPAIAAFREMANDPYFDPLSADTDATAPTAAIGAPADGATVGGTVSVAATASDNVGVTKVELLVNGAVKASSAAAPYRFSWNTTSVADGTAALQARAHDAAGNVATSAAVRVTVANADSTKPTVALTSPADASEVARYAIVPVAASAADDRGVKKVEFSVNGSLTCTDWSAPYACSWTVTSEVGSVNAVQATAYDAAGNSASTSVQVVTGPDTGSGTGSSAATLSDKLVPSRGVLFGVRAKPRAGRTEQEELQYLEQKIGRRFDLERVFARWDTPIPTPAVGLSLSQGRQVALSWTARREDGTPVPWSEIANGAHDEWIASRADAFKALGRPIILIFHHEPEDDRRANGTSADYRAAWRHVVSVFRARGATNVVWGWTLMASSFGRSWVGAYYPGDDVVDWIGADGYNWFGSSFVPDKPWLSFASVYRAFYAWGTAHGKPLMAAEYGVLEDRITPNPLRKARWFAEMREALKRMPQLKAVAYFNAFEWPFDSSEAATTAFREMANDPYFSPFTKDADPTAPTAQLASLTEGDTVRGTVGVTATASDNASVGAVELVVNGVVRATETSAPYRFSWNTETAVNGSATVQVRAYDLVGNVGTSAPVPVTVNNTTIRGTAGDDVLVGTPGDDVFRGYGGNDVIHGGGGNDVIYGGPGRDRLYGEDGDDILFGRRGSDILYGGEGSDRIRGGLGNDGASGGNGGDIVSGGYGRDRLFGCAGTDWLRGGRGRDAIYARDGGYDAVWGGARSDWAQVDKRVDGLRRVERIF